MPLSFGFGRIVAFGFRTRSYFLGYWMVPGGALQVASRKKLRAQGRQDNTARLAPGELRAGNPNLKTVAVMRFLCTSCLRVPGSREEGSRTGFRLMPEPGE